MTDITIVSGGLRDPSATRLLADRLAAGVHRQLGEDAGVMSVIELRPLARAIADAMITGFPSKNLDAAFQTVANGDGLIAVTPAFNASYGGLFKSFFDVLPEETLTDMPVLVAATGGTERHSLVLEHAMRPLFSYLRAIVAPTAVYAATGDFGSSERGRSLSRRIDKASRDFVRLLNSCGRREPRDPFAEELHVMEGLLAPDTPGPPGER